jgi:arginine/lysine/histidine/glutamine transport system substrate-binding and permease protein
MTKMTRTAFLRSVLLGALSAGLIAACGGGNETSNVWKVGTEPAFPPFESVGDGDQLIGFDIDLMNAIGEKAGKTIEFQSLPFDGLIPALQSGSIDAAISGMTITEERAETVSFSEPYFDAGLAIAVHKDTKDIQSLEDLKGKRIAVQLGTTGADKANAVPDAQVSTFDSAPLALQELSNKKVDAVINDSPVTLDAIATGNIPNINVVGELLTEEKYGIALPKDSPNLEALNAALAEIKADGTYAELYKKWFASEPPAP